MTDNNQNTGLQIGIIESSRALQIFTTSDGLDPILQDIQKKVDEFIPDVTTKKGREQIASIAHNISKSKTYLDNVGKELVTELKKTPKLVDAARKQMRDYLDNLKQEVRKPLTKLEQEEAALEHVIYNYRQAVLLLEINDLRTVRNKLMLSAHKASKNIKKEIIELLHSTIKRFSEQVQVKLEEIEQIKQQAYIDEERKAEIKKIEKQREAIAAEQAKLQAERYKLEQEKSKIKELEEQQARIEREKIEQEKLAKIKAEIERQELIQAERNKLIESKKQEQKDEKVVTVEKMSLSEHYNNTTAAYNELRTLLSTVEELKGKDILKSLRKSLSGLGAAIEELKINKNK